MFKEINKPFPGLIKYEVLKPPGITEKDGCIWNSKNRLCDFTITGIYYYSLKLPDTSQKIMVILELQKNASNERNNFYYGGNYSRQPNKRTVVDENNYIREIFTDVSEWDPEVKHVNEEEIKKFEKKEERKYRYNQRKK